MSEGRSKEIAGTVEAPQEDSPAEVAVDVQPITVTFYTCGDGGCPGRRCGTLDLTNVYKQLAECLASPDSGQAGRKHAYPQITLAQAIQNHTYGVQDATTVLNGLPQGLPVDNIYFVGHGTGVPSGFFFSGNCRDRDGACISREEFFSPRSSLFHLSTDYVVLTLSSIDQIVPDMNNESLTEPSVQVLQRELELTTDPTVERVLMNRQWIIHDGDQYRYAVRRVPELEGNGNPTGDHVLRFLGSHTPHLENCYALVDAMKRRLVQGGHVGFLTCFTGSGNMIQDLQQRITQHSPPPAVADVTVGGYRDYFETGYTRLVRELIELWHNRVINFTTGQVVQPLGGQPLEASGSCGDDIIPAYQVEAPAPLTVL